MDYVTIILSGIFWCSLTTLTVTVIKSIMGKFFKCLYKCCRKKNENTDKADYAKNKNTAEDSINMHKNLKLLLVSKRLTEPSDESMPIYSQVSADLPNLIANKEFPKQNNSQLQSSTQSNFNLQPSVVLNEAMKLSKSEKVIHSVTENDGGLNPDGKFIFNSTVLKVNASQQTETNIEQKKKADRCKFCHSFHLKMGDTCIEETISHELNDKNDQNQTHKASDINDFITIQIEERNKSTSSEAYDESNSLPKNKIELDGLQQNSQKSIRKSDPCSLDDPIVQREKIASTLNQIHTNRDFGYTPLNTLYHINPLLVNPLPHQWNSYMNYPHLVPSNESFAMSQWDSHPQISNTAFNLTNNSQALSNGNDCESHKFEITQNSCNEKLDTDTCLKLLLKLYLNEVHGKESVDILPQHKSDTVSIKSKQQKSVQTEEDYSGNFKQQYKTIQPIADRKSSSNESSLAQAFSCTNECYIEINHAIKQLLEYGYDITPLLNRNISAEALDAECIHSDSSVSTCIHKLNHNRTHSHEEPKASNFPNYNCVHNDSHSKVTSKQKLSSRLKNKGIKECPVCNVSRKSQVPKLQSSNKIQNQNMSTSHSQHHMQASKVNTIDDFVPLKYITDHSCTDSCEFSSALESDRHISTNSCNCSTKDRLKKEKRKRHTDMEKQYPFQNKGSNECRNKHNNHQQGLPLVERAPTQKKIPENKVDLYKRNGKQTNKNTDKLFRNHSSSEASTVQPTLSKIVEREIDSEVANKPFSHLVSNVIKRNSDQHQEIIVQNRPENEIRKVSPLCGSPIHLANPIHQPFLYPSQPKNATLINNHNSCSNAFDDLSVENVLQNKKGFDRMTKVLRDMHRECPRVDNQVYYKTNNVVKELKGVFKNESLAPGKEEI